MQTPWPGFYIGPEQGLPLASTLAALLGFVLIFWNKVRLFFSRIAKRVKHTMAGRDSS